MSVPKRRQTSSRRDRRRHHNDKVSAPTAVTCAQCGAKTIPHRACGECGTYKGRPVINKKD